jgi:hypothetical protein
MIQNLIVNKPVTIPRVSGMGLAIQRFAGDGAILMWDVR